MHSQDWQNELNEWWAGAWAPPAQLNPWQWGEAELEFSARSSPFPGRFRSSITPYIRGPLEAFREPVVRRITLCWSAQSAKTTCLLVALAYCVSQDPGPALVVQSSESAARSFSKNRLQPLIQDCPALARHMSGKKHDFNALEMLLDRMTVYLQGAGSPAQLAMRPIRFLFADEIDKWIDDSDKEADALSLAQERTKSYRNHKQVLASTPTNERGPIWQSYLAGSQEAFFLPCSQCGSLFALEWSMLQWPESKDKEEIQNETYLECPHCQASLSEKDKGRMLQAGEWIAQNPEAPRSHRSFHLNELYSPLTRWGDLVLKFLQASQESKTGNMGPLHNFINSSLAEPWVEDEHRETKPPEEIMALCDDRRPGQVPDDGVIAMTAGVDTQDNGFWYVIRAWGKALTSWLILEGFVPDLDALSHILWGSAYTNSQGKKHIVHSAFIDSGGHRTEEVYSFCRRNPKAKPIKGEQRLYGQPWKVSVIDKIHGRDGKQYPIPGGMQLIRVDTNHFKDLLAGKLNVPQGQEGEFRLHAEPSRDYIQHLTSEYRDEKGIWRKSRKRNDLWDCEVYALAAAEVIGVRFTKSPGQKKAKDHRPKRPRVNPYTGMMPGEYWRR